MKRWVCLWRSCSPRSGTSTSPSDETTLQHRMDKGFCSTECGSWANCQGGHGAEDARSVAWPDEEGEESVKRRRVLWVVLACLLGPVALYALLPVATAAGLTYFLHRQGYQRVTVQL